MSTRVGTLQGSPAGRSIWPAAILASLVMLTIAVAAISLGRDRPQPTAKTTVGEQTVVGGTAANAPSEVRGGLAKANGRGGVRLAPHVPRRGAEASGSFDGGTVGNNPGGLSGGAAKTSVDNTVRDAPIVVNGHICGQCG